MLFVCFYVATLIALAWVRFPLPHWIGLISVSFATVAAIEICERRRWRLGLFVPPRIAVVDTARGMAWGFALIGSCALLVMASSDVRHQRGAGFPWIELLTTFIPAVVHEELLFRGYGFQKLYRWHRGFAIVFVAVIFAALHARNDSVTILGLANIFLGGILLGLAYARFERLWFPIGVHLAWNLMTGPILGHEVSGYESRQTVLVETGEGPPWITGGEFGLEGSVWMTVIVIAAIGLMARLEYDRRAKR